MCRGLVDEVRRLASEEQVRVMHACSHAMEKQLLGLASFARAEGRMSGHTGNAGGDNQASSLRPDLGLRRPAGRWRFGRPNLGLGCVGPK